MVNGKKRKNKVTQFFIIIVVITLIILMLLNFPWLNISRINVTGNSVLSQQDVSLILEEQLSQNKNILAFDSRYAKKSLLANPYIKEVDIKKAFPDTLTIEIKERSARCYIEYANMNIYLIIDEYGYVLGTSTFVNRDMPVVTDLVFNQFSIGAVLEPENKTAFENVVLLAGMFHKYEMTDVESIDISDPENIKLHIRGIEVKIGSFSDADKKVSKVKVAIEELFKQEAFANGDIRGFIDAKDADRNLVFSPLR